MSDLIYDINNTDDARLQSNFNVSRHQNTQRQSIILPEIRIEIHSTPSPELTQNTNNIMPSTFTSVTNENHRHEHRRNNLRRWTVNFRDVFQGVRPFGQRVQNIYNARPWMHNSSLPFVGLRNQNFGRREQRLQTNSENLNSINPNYLSVNTQDVGSINDRRPPHIHESTSSASRPIYERVAALTRDDPPNLLAPDISRRQRDNGIEQDSAITEVFAQVPEVRQALNTLIRYIPFICILLVKSAYDHCKGITDLFILGAIFIHSNSVVRDQVSKQANKQMIILLKQIAFILFVIIFKNVYRDSDTYLGITLYNTLPNSMSLGQLLFSVVITDFLLKLITILIKIFVIMLPSNIIKYRNRGRIFMLIEAFSQIYRALAPVQPWISFLLGSYSGVEKIFAMLLSAGYMVLKAFDFIDQAKLCKKAVIGIFKKVNYGEIPTKDQVNAAGGQCAICHDTFDTPVILECNHVFCESCVGMWFSRQQTCPLCRARVTEDSSWHDGATSFFLHIY